MLDTQPPPSYVFDTDIAATEATNYRLVQSDRRLIEASRELLFALQLYAKARGETDGLDVMPLADDPDAGAELVRDPQKLSEFVNGVLADRASTKPSISSRLGSAMSKVYPLLSLTLGTTSAVAEASTFVPVKGAVNALSLLLAVCQASVTRRQFLTWSIDCRPGAHQGCRLPKAARPAFIPGSSRGRRKGTHCSAERNTFGESH